MVKEFEGLKQNEIELMLKAPILVCILIAGADGKIDRKEIKEAINMSQERRKGSLLLQFSEEVSEDFEDKLKICIQDYPFDRLQRNATIEQELASLNTVLPKLDKEFAKEFYEMLVCIAERIAISSGGLMGIKSVDDEEAKYLTLSMIKDPAF